MMEVGIIVGLTLLFALTFLWNLSQEARIQALESDVLKNKGAIALIIEVVRAMRSKEE